MLLTAVKFWGKGIFFLPKTLVSKNYLGEADARSRTIPDLCAALGTALAVFKILALTAYNIFFDHNGCY